MKEIKKLASGQWGRNLKLIKLLYGSGKNFLNKRGEDFKSRLGHTLESDIHHLFNELGLMKGPVMKVGQMLSIYSEVLLPKELQAVINQLENTSFYLNWDVIKKNIPEKFFGQLEIEEKPFAAASLGQVHRAKIRQGEVTLALKIQYKGVEKAINNDVMVLKVFLKLADLLPRDHEVSYLFEEVKKMLYQETDYTQELHFIKRFNQHVKNHQEYATPAPYEKFCTNKILATEYTEAIPLRQFDQLKLTEEETTKLAKNFFRLFFYELFEWEIIQTDPHPGNYLVQRDESGTPQIVLLDFGACKELTGELKEMYQRLMRTVINGRFENFLQCLFDYNFLQSNSSFNRELLKEYFDIIARPFEIETPYDWGKSTIADELVKRAPKVIKEISVYRPPRDIIFIDRKMGGIFFILKLLNAKFPPREIVEEFLNKYENEN